MTDIKQFLLQKFLEDLAKRSERILDSLTHDFEKNGEDDWVGGEFQYVKLVSDMKEIKNDLSEIADIMLFGG